MRQTKIICTIGPKTYEYKNLLKLAKQGMNIARLNMSHGTYEWHKSVIDRVKEINQKEGFSISIMLDTKGPEIRSGDLEEDIVLNSGDKFTFTTELKEKYPKNTISINYIAFVDDVDLGDIILVDGGIMSFEVKSKTERDIICECKDSGVLTSRRHLNILGKSANLPSLMEKDWKDIEFGINAGINFIALSFVKDADSVKAVKDYVLQMNADVNVISKIESAESMKNLEAIVKESDGIMVARGDLGSEMLVEEVPHIQDRLIKLSRKYAKPIIIATHLLESMVLNPTPTRAEIGDITQSIKEKVDAIMLSAETATGKYVYKSVNVMNRVALYTENILFKNKNLDTNDTLDYVESIVYCSAQLGNKLNIKGFLVFTETGFIASLMSKYRPNTSIYAFTENENSEKKMNLLWGVKPFKMNYAKTLDESVKKAISILKKKDRLKKDDKIIVVSDLFGNDKSVDNIQVRVID